MEEKKIAEETGAENVSNDNSTVSPTSEVIDPRIVDIIGEEKIQEAYGEQPKVEEKPTEDEAKKVEEKKEEENQENKVVDEKKEEVQTVAPQTVNNSRLDRRTAKFFIQNRILMGDENIPTEEEVMADLQKFSREEREQAMHFHRLKNKELRGEKPNGSELDPEDVEALKEEDRETIRQEILAEQNEIKTKESFIEFLGSHPELDSTKKEYNQKLDESVYTLFKAGMDIETAYKTVTDQIQALKDEAIAAEKGKKNAALSGVLAGTGQITQNPKELTWDDVQKIQDEDPAMYRKMVAEGKFSHLM